MVEEVDPVREEVGVAVQEREAEVQREGPRAEMVDALARGTVPRI